jgi:hypothetical protein
MRARVTLLSTEAGGRLTSIRNSGGQHYLPHVVVHDGEYLGVRVSLSGSDLTPGETAELILEPLYPELVDYSALSVGASFELREGPKVVGHGVILTH